MSRNDQIIEYVSKNGSATIEEIALHYTGESRQNLFTSNVVALEKSGLLTKTQETRSTTNGGSAFVYKFSEDRLPTSLHKYKCDEHEVFISTISPSEAKLIQEHMFNIGNRDLNSKGVHEYTEEMESGIFYPCSSLVFSRNGVLMDGHHRLTSQIKANVYVTYVVQVGGDPEWNVILGNAVKRAAKDAVKMTAHKLEGDLLTKKQQALFSTVVTHMIANHGRTDGVSVTGSKTGNNKIVEDYMVDNYDFLVKFEELHNQLIEETDYSMYVAERSTNKLKRGIITASADLFATDPVFAKKYLFSVFGRYSDGVFGGSTPTSVKQNIGKYLRRRNEGLDPKICEQAVYSALVHGFTAMREALASGKTEVGSSPKYNLKPNSNVLIKTEGKKVVGIKRPPLTRDEL